MTEEMKNNIDKLDGMTKIKGKCGYEIIGGCSDLRRLKQENKELEEKLNAFVEHSKTESDKVYYKMLDYKTALEEIQKAIKSYDLNVDNGVSVDTLYTIRKIIDEVLNESN